MFKSINKIYFTRGLTWNRFVAYCAKENSRFSVYLNKYQQFFGNHNILIAKKGFFITETILAFFLIKNHSKYPMSLKVVISNSKFKQNSDRDGSDLNSNLRVPTLVDKEYCATVHYCIYILYEDKMQNPCGNHERKHFPIRIGRSYPFDLINKFIKSKMGKIGSLSHEGKNRNSTHRITLKAHGTWCSI